MKIGIEWLKEYTDINVEPKELADKLTMTGSKVESIEQKGNDIKNVVVGKILEIVKHPDADKLVVTKVNVGTEIVQIVTGAENIKENDIVPIAKDGSELPGEVKIKKGELRGVLSCGMMCSVGELGLNVEDYPGQIEHGIMILPPNYETFLGMDIVEVLNLKEDIIEFEITSNRPDCLSAEGLGREAAVTLGEEFKNPHKDLENINLSKVDEIEGLKVDIEASDLCYRYVCRVVKNVKIAESPDWMKRRLIACGMRPINNIVDITNYVMLELGQPMHAFDINSIEGKRISVRRAKENEVIKTLDGEERNLNTEMLVIADKAKPVAVAGVMGGENSEIEKDTNIIVFESAVFNGGSVRITAKNLGLRTESSSRYEKGLSQENALRAINRAVELVKILGAGEAENSYIDVYPTEQQQNKIEITSEKINDLLGTEVSKEDITKILNSLDIKVEGNTVIPPYFRQDLENLADIAEEVLRIYGYDKLGSTLPSGGITLGLKSKGQKLEDELRKLLVGIGYSEICTYALINEKDLKKCNISQGDLLYKTINIKNKLSEDYSMMRTTTVPSILQAISTNFAKKNKDVNLFEIARVYNDESGNIEKGEVPNEPQMVTIAAYGEGKDFYTLKGDVEKILESSNVKRYMVQKDEKNKSMHPRKNCKNMYWKRRDSSIRRSSSCSKSKLWSKRKGLSCIYLFR
ncbi:MAG: phenylalanine--tRNA ligase subunit beta [Lachnospiraceae bacterium]|jgi:phenylalanyl-tRNA synthetase beta chain|nr:phenylalanine--tRNA ligase subunit beta [Lachnospiraceae bacterium]